MNNYIKLPEGGHIIQLDDIICVSNTNLDPIKNLYENLYGIKITWANQKTLIFKYYTKESAEKDFDFISEKLCESNDKVEKNIILG